MKTVLDFKKGMRVRYVPDYVSIMSFMNTVNRGSKEIGIQDGVVSSTNGTYVFVKYDNAVMKFVTGDEPYTSQATPPENLIILDNQ